jgi:anti-sigma factor RsiW
MTNQQPPEPMTMDCARAQDLIFDALEADETTPVPAEQEASLERHLADCDACLVYRHTLQNLSVSLSDALSDIEDVPVPAGLEDRIMANIAQNAAPHSEPSRLALFGGNARRYAPLAAAVLVIALAIPLVTQMIHPGGTPSDTPQVAQGVHSAASVPDATPTSQTQTPAQTMEPTQLASVPNAEQPVASSLPETTQPGTTQTGAITAPASARHGSSNHTHATTRTSVAHNPDAQSNFPAAANANNTSSTSNNTIAVDPSSLASALPQNASQQFSSTYGSESENDVYYDPVSNLVGF